MIGNPLPVSTLSLPFCKLYVLGWRSGRLLPMQTLPEAQKSLMIRVYLLKLKQVDEFQSNFILDSSHLTTSPSSRGYGPGHQPFCCPC
jgi:hypothetical protein